jgi:hypothetical protein
MGLRSSTFAIGWFITYFVLTIIPCALLAIASSYFGFFKYTSPATLFALVFLYVQSLLAFAFVVSTFFNSSKVMTSLPFVLHSYYSWPSQPIICRLLAKLVGCYYYCYSSLHMLSMMPQRMLVKLLLDFHHQSLSHRASR